MHTFTIKNFQSIKNTTFDVRGFTVLVGENDIGKSSCFRAIHSLFNSRYGDAFIKHGEKFSEVTCETPEFTISWNKPKKSGATYSFTYEGKTQEYGNLGRSLPDFFETLGYSPLELKSGQLDPHFSGQRDLPFLVTDSNSKKVLTEFFSEMLKFGPLAEGLNKVNKDVRDTGNELSLLTKQEEAALEYLNEFPDFDKLDREFSSLEKLGKDLELEEFKKAKLKEFISLPKLPEVDLSEVGELSVKSLSEKMTLRDKVFEYLEIGEIPEVEWDLPSTQELEKSFDARNTFSSYKELAELPTELGFTVNDQNLKHLEVLVSLRNEVEVDLKKLDILFACLQAMTLSRDILALERAGVTVEEQVKDLEKDFQKGLEEIGECPLCGAAHG